MAAMLPLTRSVNSRKKDRTELGFWFGEGSFSVCEDILGFAWADRKNMFSDLSWLLFIFYFDSLLVKVGFLSVFP